MGIFCERQWETVEAEYESGGAYPYVVLDKVFTLEFAQDLRLSLLSHWGWCRKNPTATHLHNFLLDRYDILYVGSQLRERLPRLLQKFDAVQAHSLLYTTNSEGPIHFDYGHLSANIWLTPDEYNVNPGSGGMTLFSAFQDFDLIEQSLHTHPRIVAALEADPSQILATIPYKFNRMVIFNSLLYHRTSQFTFNHEHHEGHRLNLSFIYGNKPR